MAKNWTMEALAGYLQDKQQEREFNRICNTFDKPLFGLVRNILHNKEDAEEIVGDVFMELIPKMGSFESEIHLKRFLYKTARNKAINNSRKQQTRKKHIPLIPLNDSHLDSSETEFDLDVLEAETQWEYRKELINSELGRLKPKQRRIVYHYYWEGKSRDEIANLLKIKKNTVYRNLKRGLRAIEEALKSKGMRMFLIMLFIHFPIQKNFAKKLYFLSTKNISAVQISGRLPSLIVASLVNNRSETF